MMFNCQCTIKSDGVSIADSFISHVKGMTHSRNTTIESHFCDSTTIHHYPHQNIPDVLSHPMEYAVLQNQ